MVVFVSEDDLLEENASTCTDEVIVVSAIEGSVVYFLFLFVDVETKMRQESRSSVCRSNGSSSVGLWI